MEIQIWQPGDKIKNDRFEIIESLDRGGFGIIYLAKDTKRNNEIIVIKTLNPYLQSKLDFPQRQQKFIEEGVKHRGFKHPHIVKIHSLIKVGELSGLVMEYIPGQNLREYVKKEGKISEEKSLLYIDQIAQALDCIHDEKYIHRGVHPGNIIKRQDLDQTVLIDFGIAEEFFDKTFSVSNNDGMEFYKPVEQYEKIGNFRAYTDIYALAATLYYLLAGITVGNGAYNFKSIMRKYFRDSGELSIERMLWGELENLGISEKTQAAIKAGMGIEPSERPQTITEFRELLGLVGTSKTNNSQTEIIEKHQAAIKAEMGIEAYECPQTITESQSLLEMSSNNSNFNNEVNISNIFDSIGLNSESELAAFYLELEAVTLDDYWLTVMLIVFPLWNLTKQSTVPPLKLVNAASLFANSNTLDSFDSNLEAINLDDLDENPFDGLSDLLGEETGDIEKDNITQTKDLLNRNHLKLNSQTILSLFQDGDKKFSYEDVSNLDLVNAFLPGIILSNANCIAINLQGANLKAGKFEKADFSNAVLEDTILRNSDFSYANLQNANLQCADLSGADFQGAILHGANLCGANLTDAIVTKQQLNRAKTNFATVFPKKKRGIS